jgi:hypothetical protein
MLVPMIWVRRICVVMGFRASDRLGPTPSPYAQYAAKSGHLQAKNHRSGNYFPGVWLLKHSFN